MKITQAFNFLFPNHTCISCGDEINSQVYPNLCELCFKALPHTNPVKITHKEMNFTHSFAPFYYKPPICPMVLALKYACEGLTAKTLAPFLAKSIEGEIFDLIIPVPLTKRRARERGYNQALLLSIELSKLTGVPVNMEILKRIKTTRPHIKMSAEERALNQKNAFAIENQNLVKDKHILLVDDIFTSGATLNECAKVLMHSKAASANVLTVARVSQQ